MKKIKPNILISILCIILFLIVLIFYLTNNIEFIDNTIYKSIIYFKSDIMTNIMKTITFLGSVEFIVIIIFFLLILSIFKGKKPIILVYLIVLESILNYIIKNIIKRPRPNILQLVTEKSYSFPSGHTMVSVVLYGFLIYLISKSKIDKNIKIVLSIILSIIPILVMISRIYLGVHYFSDVCAGMFIGLAFLLISIEILERKRLI